MLNRVGSIAVVVGIVVFALACQGEPGAVGPAGAQGERGEQGEAGPKGAQGSAGEPGAEGRRGSQGDAGPRGERGERGPAGAQGPAGDRGQAGPAGEAGAPGRPGAVGPQGARGPAGPVGPAGPTASIVQDAREEAVCVSVRDQDGWFRCSTGFYVDESGTVMTPSHVVEGALQVAVSDPAGVTIDYVIGASRHDLAAVFLRPKDLRVTSKPVEVASSVRDGQPVFAVGYPSTIYEGDLQLVTVGRVAQADDVSIIAALPAAPGSSGSPVFDLEGRLLGFVEAIDPDGGPFTYIVPVLGKSVAP